MSESPRRGDVRKCPICGSQADPDAFHCPTCRNYFCFHCRARLLPGERQFKCVNLTCDYYGKLVCDICDPASEREEPPAVYAEPEDGYWPAWLILILLAAIFLWYFFSFPVAVVVAVVAYVIGGLLLQSAGINIFGRSRQIEYRRATTIHACIRCEQPVKELPESRYPTGSTASD